MLESNKNYGTIAFAIFAILSLVASFYPSVHPIADKEFNSGTIAWMLSSTCLVFIMTPGLSFFYGGMVNRKNVVSTMLQSFICLGIITSLWYAVGFSLAFGEDLYGIIGNPLTYLFFDNVGLASNPSIPASITIPFVLFAFFQLKFAVITPALITGSFAERIRFWSYVIFVCLFCLFIYAPLAHWAWHPEGFLCKMGILDFAGGTVVHISAGFAALAGAIVLGRRNSHLEKKDHHPSNIAYILLGTALLWFGWFGFNAGSALDANGLAITAFFNTNLASASAMLSWILLDSMKGRKVSALGACIGAVVGLVAITPAAGYVTFGASIFIGFLSSVVSNYAVHWKNKTSIDDTLDVFPCHGIGGIMGMILTGVFAKEGFSSAGAGLIYGETALFFNHIIGLLIVGAFTFGGSWVLFKLTDLIFPLRVQPEEEKLGLDLSQHNEKIYHKED